MNRRLLILFFLLVTSSHFAVAQVGQGGVRGKIVDSKTNEPLPFVNVVVELNGAYQAGGATDFDGKYFIKPIPAGKYDIKVKFIGYKPTVIQGIQISSEKIAFVDIKMDPTIEQLEDFIVVDYAIPLIDKDNTVSGGTVSKEDILKMPGRDAASIAETIGGVFSQDDGGGGLNIRGAREDANYYFIDGIKVRGSNALPQSAIEQVSVFLGGLPAQYGDVTGGVISITTKGPSQEYAGNIEYVTSGYKLGDKMYGLDKFGHNLLEFGVSGPLYRRKLEDGKKDKALAGFFLSGNFQHDVDPRPTAIGMWKVKDDVLADIKQTPLRRAPFGPGAFQNAEYLRLDNFEKTSTRLNVARTDINLSGKLDFNTGKNTNLTFGGTYNYNRGNISGGQAYQLYNWENNPERIQQTWRVFGRFTQRFAAASPQGDEKSAAVLKNVYYSIQADYNKFNSTTWDENHRDNLFAYGYYGQYQRYIDRDYGFGVDSSTGLFGIVQTTFVDTLIGFKPANDINPEGANYVSNYYRLYGWQGYNDEGNPMYDPEIAGDALRNFVEIQTLGGMRNGDIPRDIYNMWRSPAYQYNGYQIVDNDQIRVSAMGSADIKNHSFTLGFEYEQRNDRGYSVSPVGLWNLGRLLVNNHITNLDFSNPTIDTVFGTRRFSYERLNSSPGEFEAGGNQRYFDYRLRQAFGFDPDGVDFIDFDNYTPDQLKIEYFSADELLNNGQSYVGYHGYDHHGNRLNFDPTFDDFFTARDQYGNYTRPIGAFRPIYVAGFIQDKFAFDDLVFNVGLRVDRFDANQKVLKDQFVLFPTVKAGEDEALALLGEGQSKPSNIGDNYVVYVDDLLDPQSIVGYRNGTTWYNAEGAEISNPQILETATGIAPLLVDKTRTGSQQILSDGFEDYKPQVNFMPRIAFSFPISDEALFFAHYDILTKRPTSGARLNPTDYLFLESVANTLNNPNLRPERTIDYELGFQQKLTKSSSLKIAAFYRELRDMVQIVQVRQAYPRTYRTLENLDYGTVKGLTLTYDLRRTKNIWMRTSYTLQFAEGTGSDATTSLSLVRAGRDNLRTTNPLNYDQRHTIVTTVDYRYGKGKDYNGPVINDKQILARTGANFVFNAGSGVPFSGQRLATSSGLLSEQGALLEGSINGSRLPWQFRADARIDRDIDLELGSGEKKRKVGLNVYTQILNIFNNKNVIQVYRFTGNANDDGYLAAAQAQPFIQSQIDEQAFREMYTMRMNNPFFFNLPRRFRVGVLLTF